MEEHDIIIILFILLSQYHAHNNTEKFDLREYVCVCVHEYVRYGLIL